MKLVRSRCAVAALLAAAAITLPPRPADAVACAGDTGAAALTTTFADHVAGIAGADYQRSLPLPDGRVLWMFQDAFLERPGGDDRLVHNIGLAQEGSCFTLLRSGTAEDPAAWIAPELTDTFHHWFWPLGATVTTEGTIAVFVAELHERGPSYLSHSEPVATWVAVIDPVTLTPIELRPAPDPGPRLYGWSVASDDDYTYLYGHCYRQFGFGYLGHDACSAEVTVARLPLGEIGGTPRYWDGSGWVADPASAVNIAPHVAPDGARRAVNPMQIARVDGRWIAVTKEGDWWGDTVYLDRAPSPAGPWTTSAVVKPVPLGPDHHTYFASIISHVGTEVVVGLSNNAWDGHSPDAYRPTFSSIPLSHWDPPGGSCAGCSISVERCRPRKAQP